MARRLNHMSLLSKLSFLHLAIHCDYLTQSPTACHDRMTNCAEISASTYATITFSI